MNTTQQERCYRARLVFTGREVLQDATVRVRRGTIVEVQEGAGADEFDEDLGEVALWPGLVNAHSHAFQRLIRGRTEFLHGDRLEEDFWSWRELMYDAALRLDPGSMRAVARQAFLEMVCGGVTAVGEFHYVHHQPDGRPYDDANLMAEAVIEAAREVGLRICLLRVAYQRGGHGRPAAPEQRRFVEPDVETFLQRAEALADRYGHDPLVSVGLAPHSIRAVDASWLESIAQAAPALEMPVHIHACEQRAEIEQSLQEYGKSPVEVLEDLGLLGARCTLVHATHLGEGDPGRIARAGASVCACPTTERNLGDGFLPAQPLLQAGVPICLGSDSQAQIDLFDETRLVELHERLRRERRNVLAPLAGPLGLRDEAGSPHLETARVLAPMATAWGARSLGLSGGSLQPGQPADMIALNLRHPTLLGANGDSLLAMVTLGGAPAAVRQVWVGGRALLDGQGRHPLQESIGDDYLRHGRRLLASGS